MENWEQHIHLSGGHCFKMFFVEYDSVIRFKVIGSDSFGTKKAINCLTDQSFEFNRNQLYKREYATLIEIDCNECNT